MRSCYSVRSACRTSTLEARRVQRRRDARADRRRGDHQRRIRREVRRHLDARAARTHADARGSPVRAEEHHRGACGRGVSRAGSAAIASHWSGWSQKVRSARAITVRVVSARRAFILLCKELAEVIKAVALGDATADADGCGGADV